MLKHGWSLYMYVGISYRLTRQNFKLFRKIFKAHQWHHVQKWYFFFFFFFAMIVYKNTLNPRSETCVQWIPWSIHFNSALTSNVVFIILYGFVAAVTATGDGLTFQLFGKTLEAIPFKLKVYLTGICTGRIFCRHNADLGSRSRYHRSAWDFMSSGPR